MVNQIHFLLPFFHFIISQFTLFFFFFYIATSSSNVGGLFGKMEGIEYNDCHNLGFASDPTNNLVKGNDNVGGFAGIVNGSPKILKSGISRGRITGRASVGGFLVFFFQHKTQL